VKWEEGLSAEKIKKALNGFACDYLHNGYFKTSKITKDLTLIFDALNVDFDFELPSMKELRKLFFMA
jgi:hypothetical protein